MTTQDTTNTTATVLPLIEKFATHYERYNSSIGQGENKTTHTASVKFGSTHGLAVVKAFAIGNKGWANEAIAWTLGKSLGVVQPPQAMLLIASKDDLKDAKETELINANRLLDDSNDLIVFWCASRLNTKPPQHLAKRNWEDVVLRGSSGQCLAAFDGWIGNADRIASNAPYWIAQGVIAAIDHERLAFNQDWTERVPAHMDRMGIANTKLIDRFHQAQKTNKFTKKQATEISSSLYTMSDQHLIHLTKCWDDIEKKLLINFDAAAAANIKVFLEDRGSDSYIKDRLGMI